MSEVVRKLREVRGMAWAALIPAIDHAIMRAEECEFIAAEASNLAQCSVEPAYPPIVLKLAAALGGGDHECDWNDPHADDCAACDAMLSECSRDAVCCGDCTHGANWPPLGGGDQ